MAEEGKIYTCETCGAEVKVIKKTAQDPNVQLLLAAGKRCSFQLGKGFGKSRGNRGSKETLANLS